MQLRTMVVLAAVLLSCSGNDDDGPIDTVDECKANGGRVVTGTGPSIAMCGANEDAIGSLPIAFEGALCCRTKK